MRVSVCARESESASATARDMYCLQRNAADIEGAGEAKATKGKNKARASVGSPRPLCETAVCGGALETGRRKVSRTGRGRQGGRGKKKERERKGGPKGEEKEADSRAAAQRCRRRRHNHPSLSLSHARQRPAQCRGKTSERALCIASLRRPAAAAAAACTLARWSRPRLQVRAKSGTSSSSRRWGEAKREEKNGPCVPCPSACTGMQEKTMQRGRGRGRSATPHSPGPKHREGIRR